MIKRAEKGFGTIAPIESPIALPIKASSNKIPPKLKKLIISI